MPSMSVFETKTQNTRTFFRNCHTRDIRERWSYDCFVPFLRREAKVPYWTSAAFAESAVSGEGKHKLLTFIDRLRVLFLFSDES